MINIGNIAQVDHFYTDRALPQDIASIVQKENIQLRLCPALNSL
jgi:DeoR/GlpR family transcriptional regulator of sugar metabolism